MVNTLTSWKVFKVTCTDLGFTNVTVATKLNLNNLYKNQSQAWFKYSLKKKVGKIQILYALSFQKTQTIQTYRK